MSNDMVDPDDLDHLPGAPFSDAEVDAAVAAVRSAAGWHICPERTDTVVLDVASWEPRLRLPTKFLVSVDEILDADTDAEIPPAAYRVSAALGQVIRRSAFWPCGYSRVSVEFTHGWDEVPADLLAVIGEAVLTNRRDQSVRTMETLDFQQGFGTGGASITTNPIGTGAVLQRYSLWQAGIA